MKLEAKIPQCPLLEDVDYSLLILSGPSGSGKSTIAKALEETHGYKQIVSFTTREKREGEVDGKDYIFVDEATAIKEVESGVLEYAYFNGNHYGIFMEPTYKNLELGENMVVVVEPHGFRTLKQLFPNALSVMLLPQKPSKRFDWVARRMQLESNDPQVLEFIKNRTIADTSIVAAALEYDHILLPYDSTEAPGLFKQDVAYLHALMVDRG